MRFLATCFLVLWFVAPGNAQAPGRIAGDYVEVRSGQVYTCGCLYSGEMVTGGKEAILVWRIATGEHEGMSLAGVKVAAVILSESNLGSEAAARRSALYVDGISSGAQQAALLALWKREYSHVLGEITSIHAVPIRFEHQGEVVSVSVPGIAELQVRKARLPEDAHPGSSRWYGPLSPLNSFALMTSLYYEYSGRDFARQWREMLPSISGYSGDFAFEPGM